ncbi:MAG TPA: sulfatase [Micromonosporaceae bacterium]|nr:sulfatase [Micromonosporaceae bacterium]
MEPAEDAASRPAGPRVITALACLLVMFVLVAPSELGHLTPAALLRIPLDGLLGIAIVLVLPPRARQVAAVVIGVAFGLLALLKIAGIGFSTFLDRPFDPVFDWPFLQSAVVFLKQSFGQVGAIATVIGAVVLALAVLALVTLSFLRITRVAVGHRRTASLTVALLAVAWVTFGIPGVQLVPEVPIASRDYYDGVLQVQESLHDKEVFAAESAVDAFREATGAEMLTALRGKDVIVALVESYGRVALEDPDLAPQIGALLDAGNSRLRAAAFHSRSGYLSSPTAGGGSWLAQATLQSGLWIDNQQRYRQLLDSDRLTLTGAFQRASWRTVAVMPATTGPWPEGEFFGYDRIYTAGDLNYQGPKYGFATMPDQYTLSTFQRSERAQQDHAPMMAAIPLVSSHAPWAPVPRLIDWDEVGDGSVFDVVPGAGDAPESVLGRDRNRVRNDYGRAIGYSLESLISFVETYGDDDLVLVFLGDHQPSPVITGTGASRDVPITIVTRDRSVLDRIADWGWQEGLKPGPQAPVWRMDTFRDRFLVAFGGQGD